MICPKCNSNLGDANYCSNCKIYVDSSAVFTKSQGNKGTWQIVPGEIIRHISESDFANIAHLSGIILQPGVSALIYSDGKEIAALDSGQYNFVSDSKIESLVNARIINQKSVRGLGLTMWKALVNVIMGRKVGSSTDNFLKTTHTKDEIIQHLNSSSNISFYLKADRPFPLLFGFDPFREGENSFVPMKIRTKVFDIDVSVSMMLQIADFRECIRYYMVGKRSLTTVDIQKAVSPYITRILQEVLRYEEINEREMPEDVNRKLVAKLHETDRFLFGLKVVGVPEISCNNEDLERFRTLARELYCSEKELDYLRRTNEFKNRLAAAEIDQKVGGARSELDLKVALDEVNKDKLLHEEEMAIFAQSLKVRSEDRANDMLDSLGQSAIRKMQIANSVQKQKLLLDAELDVAKVDVEFSKYKQEKGQESEKIDIEAALYGKQFAATRRMLESELELEDIKRRNEYKAILETDDVKTLLQKKNIEREKMKDEYEFNKLETSYNFTRKMQADKHQDLRIKQDIALSGLERMNTMNESNLDNEARRESMKRQDVFRHEEEMASRQRELESDKLQAEIQKTSIFSNMTAEQIAAAALASGIEKGTISSESVASISDAISSKKDAAAAISMMNMREEDHAKLNAERERMSQMNREDMMNLMDKTLDFAKIAVQGVNAEREKREKDKDAHCAQLAEVDQRRYNDMKEQKEEYRTQMMHEQTRIDHNQEKALEYTTKVTVGMKEKKDSSKNSESDSAEK